MLHSVANGSLSTDYASLSMDMYYQSFVRVRGEEGEEKGPQGVRYEVLLIIQNPK